ncbi:MAG TPA: AI-2E family transporter [Candidatus Pacebacteria bacterium]|nr:AI-2E family transporter [Candidatus Paceibacterota bacterium]
MNQVMQTSTNIIFRVVIILLALWFLYVIRDVIWLFLIAIIITAALDPVINRVREALKLPRALSVSVVYISFFSIVALLIAFIAPMLADQFDQLGKELPYFIAQFSQDNTVIPQDISFSDVSQKIVGLLNNPFSTTFGFLTSVISTVAVIAMSFYMSLQKDGLKDALLLMTPKQYMKYTASLVDRIQENFGRWMVGQLITMIFVGVLYYIALTALGVPYAPVLAIIGGLLEIIPYFGPIVASMPAILFGTMEDPVIGIMVAVAYFVINLIENHFLVPKIMNKAVGLNPVLIILALLIGGKIAGVVGIFLAVPIAGAIGLFIKDMMGKKVA